MPSVEYYLVAGATGRQGGSVVNALLSHPQVAISPDKIYALTRDASGVSAMRLKSRWPGINLVAGTLAEPQAIFSQLDETLWSKTAVFLAQAHGPTELADAKALIDATASRKVPYFVYSSVDRGGKALSDRDPSYVKTFADKYHIEQHLKSVTSSPSGSSMDYTILRPVYFADNAHWGFNGQICSTGWRDRLAPGQKMQIVAIRDIGRWAAEALLQPDFAGIRNDAVSIASDELTFEQMNDIFQQETRHPVPLTYGWLAALFIWLLGDLNLMYSWFRERPFGADLPWLKERLEPTDFRQWVKITVAGKRE